MHNRSTGGDISNPPPEPPCIPGKPKGIPTCQPSHCQMLNIEVLKDLGAEKQLPPEGSANQEGPTGREADFGDIKDKTQ